MDSAHAWLPRVDAGCSTGAEPGDAKSCLRKIVLAVCIESAALASGLLLARHNDQSNHRLGLVIAKRHVRHAVTRNRIKRVAREFFRHLPADDLTLDVVLLARPGMGDLDNSELSSILQQQWQKLCRHASNANSSHSRDPS